MYIDIHTHQQDTKNTFIYILDPRNLPSTIPRFSCLGIHPWYISDFDNITHFLNENFKKYNIFALGEIGLDKVHPTEYEKQIKVFQAQLDFANERFIKRLIIHGVKSYQDIFEILQKKKIKSKILLHSYQSSQQMAQQFMDHFDCYFSFGPGLLHNRPKLRDLIKSLPIEKIFLETDDQTDVSIEKVYSTAADILSVPLAALQAQIHSNFQGFKE